VATPAAFKVLWWAVLLLAVALPRTQVSLSMSSNASAHRVRRLSRVRKFKELDQTNHTWRLSKRVVWFFLLLALLKGLVLVAVEHGVQTPQVIAEEASFETIRQSKRSAICSPTCHC
jgi:hypothetical protein